jgi:hypothetical protein
MVMSVVRARDGEGMIMGGRRRVVAVRQAGDRAVGQVQQGRRQGDGSQESTGLAHGIVGHH